MNMDLVQNFCQIYQGGKEYYVAKKTGQQKLNKLGYTKEEQEGLENLMNFDFNQYNQDGEEELPTDVPTEYKFEVMLTDKQHKIIETALKEIGEESTAEGLVKICLEFLKKHGNKSSS